MADNRNQLSPPPHPVHNSHPPNPFPAHNLHLPVNLPPAQLQHALELQQPQAVGPLHFGPVPRRGTELRLQPYDRTRGEPVDGGAGLPDAGQLAVRGDGARGEVEAWGVLCCGGGACLWGCSGGWNGQFCGLCCWEWILYGAVPVGGVRHF